MQASELDLGEQRLPLSARNRNAGQEGCWDTNLTVGKCWSDGSCDGCVGESILGQMTREWLVHCYH